MQVTWGLHLQDFRKTLSATNHFKYSSIFETANESYLQSQFVTRNTIPFSRASHKLKRKVPASYLSIYKSNDFEWNT